MFLPREDGIETLAAPQKEVAAEFSELEIIPVSAEEYQNALQRLQHAGYLALHAASDVLNQHHLAIHPETSDLQLWWTGLAAVDHRDTRQGSNGTLTGTMADADIES